MDRIIDVGDPKTMELKTIEIIDKEMLRLFIKLYEMAADKKIIDEIVKNYGKAAMLVEMKEEEE